MNDLLWFKNLYYCLLKIRMTEQAIASEYSDQEMRCPVHLSIGQEAVAVGACANLSNEDVIFSTHRCHSHYIAKGGNLNEMIAELYGKSTGCAKGYGGSMHLVDERVGMMGASAIVGGSIPLAAGAALSFKQSHLPHIAVGFFGDGASEEGVFHETLNFSSRHRLPVVFICENNYLATASHMSARRPQNNLYTHGEIYGIPGIKVEGHDLLQIYHATKQAAYRARAGDGPTLIEASTYRAMNHVGPNHSSVNLSQQAKEWGSSIQTCPVKWFEKVCLNEAGCTADNLKVIRKQIQIEIEDAFEEARRSPLPEVAQ
jgi:TPP-dependent pyruvate/acetoin dehydrogenase alpha subunit